MSDQMNAMVHMLRQLEEVGSTNTRQIIGVGARFDMLSK